MPRVAITGTRGYPAYYGGLETAVRKIAPFLAEHGWDVTVHSRPGFSPEHGDLRVHNKPVWALESRSLSNLSSGLASTLSLLRDPPDVALVMSTASGFWLPLLKLRGIPSVVNTDGIEWERDKWGALAKRVLHAGAWMTGKFGTHLVFDAEAIKDYWGTHFKRSGTFIPYGGDDVVDLTLPEGIEPGTFVLMVARLVPENTVYEFFDAVPQLAQRAPIVLVGSTGWGGDLDERAANLAATHPNVTWLGHVADETLLDSLYANCVVYFHGHSVGGTNPSLVQAMAAGAPTVARDTVYSREVLGPDAPLVTPSEITTTIEALLDDPERRALLSAANIERAHERYDWTDVCQRYEDVLRLVLR
ncbi:MAG: glycosyltransferase [Ruaniaceae bacterium]|nr:glycosyltransferase [Ruaniaceae bacterium]